MSFQEQITRAIAILGSQTKLAREMGCSQQYISWLLNEADQISAETAMLVEKTTGGRVRASELRPDLPWPVPTQPSDQGEHQRDAHANRDEPAAALEIVHGDAP